MIREMREKLKLRRDPYRPSLHLTPAQGWINDPNGFIYFGGQYHVFAQYYDAKPEWGPMMWLHCASPDMMTFTRLPDALYPSEDYDYEKGCFSGSAIERDGKMYLMYTGTSHSDTQTQCLASSSDGIHFEKYAFNPVIDGGDLPAGYSPKDFRDPCVFEREGSYYVLLVSRRDDVHYSILMYRSSDLVDWTFVGVTLECEAVGCDLLECPNLAHIDGKDVLLVSGKCATVEYPNSQNCIWGLIGHLDLETGHFEVESKRRLDLGFDSYATQMVKTPDGRTLMVAWMSAWGSTYPTQKYGWCGQFSLPREVSIRDGQLVLNPARELFTHECQLADSVTDLKEAKKLLAAHGGHFLDVTLTVDIAAEGASINLGNGADRLVLKLEKDHLVIDRSHSGIEIQTVTRKDDFIRYIPLAAGQSQIKLRVIADASLVEIFADDGRADACVRIYPHKVDYNIELEGFNHEQIELDRLAVLKA